jgi:hypothetical protein
MATISKTGITDGNSIEAEHITRIIDALDGTVAREISMHQANVNYLYISSSAYQISQNNAGSIVFNAQDNDQDTIINHFGGEYSSSFTENGLITNAAITASGFQGTTSFATTASYALNAEAPEYMTLRLTMPPKTDITGSAVYYIGPSTTSDSIDKIGIKLPYACTIVSASVYSNLSATSSFEGATISPRLYHDIAGTPVPIGTFTDLDMNMYIDGNSLAINFAGGAGKWVNLRIVENDTSACVYTVTCDILIKKS